MKIDILARASLKELPQTIGKTWLDDELRNVTAVNVYEGFGEEVEKAKIQRRQFLIKRGLLSKGGVITDETLKTLEALDLDEAAKAISERLGKTYHKVPDNGRISGLYREAISRPSGKYAVIEKSKEFTLVTWRKTMDRNLGKSISGAIKGRTISWTLNEGRGQSIS